MVRWIQAQCDRPADGYGPGPDGGGEAADTSSAQRPTMRLASRPRPTTRRPRPGPDRTGQDSNAHAPFGQPQQLPASGPVRRDHLHPMLDAGTSASLVPVRCPRGRVRRPRWTPRSDRLRTPPAPSYPAGHRPLHPARHGKPEATRTGNRRTAPKAFGHPRSPPPQGGPPGHAEPPPVGPAFAAWQPRLARRWQDCQRDRNHGSDQAAAWCRSSVQAAPRRTVLHPRAILAQIILTDRSVRNKFGFSFQERRTPGCPQGSCCCRWAVYRATRSRPCASVHRPRSCRQSRSLTR
jgi:hypothetical protein